MPLKWVLADTPDKDKLDLLSEALSVPKMISSVLIHRGIETYDDARRFFRPEWQDLHDPFLMKDMKAAVDRIILAIEKKERILIYGDYDVDGITAVSVLVLFLRERGNDVFYYIPNRLKEGYGLSESGIAQAANLNISLVISVDCGITGIAEVAYARERGIDCIISDHHEPGVELPRAIAILDPKRGDCPYPFKDLAGVGVAFKLIQAIARKLNLEEETYQKYIDLVAIGSTADIVPLVDENRVLVKKGMERINRLENLGLKALAESAGIAGKPIGTGQVVFVLAPRINAVGRLGNAERAVHLFITDSESQAGEIAKVLEAENQHRKDIDEETFQEAIALINETYDVESERGVVLAKTGWHTGVVGIVASRIVERVYRPTVMIAIENGIGKGSARSIPDFDIYSALKQCEEYLIAFGGHRYAAGLTILPEKISDFRAAFNEIAKASIPEELLIQKIIMDSEITLPEISDKVVRILNQFAPFGPQNMRPVFVSRNLDVVGSPTVVGRNHLKFKVRQQGVVFDVIGFDLGDLLYRLSPGESNLDMVYVIEENHWNGQSKIQLRVKDLR